MNNGSDRINRVILAYFSKDDMPRSYMDRILNHARKEYSSQVTKQVVSRRVYYLTNKGLITIDHHENGHAIFVMDADIKGPMRRLLSNGGPLNLDAFMNRVKARRNK